MNVLGLIPARKGSKRIKNKNKKKFLGEPIILRTIKTLKSLVCLNKIYVSTDDSEIAELAKSNNCNTAKRPKDLCDDYATSTEVLYYFAKQINFNFDYLVMIYPTTPRLNIKLLDQCIKKLDESPKMHSGASVIKYAHPLERRILNKDGNFSFEINQNSNKRTQDLITYYHDAANFYVFKKSYFVGKHTLFDNTTIGIELPRDYYFDIDDMDDWDYAESVIKE